MIINHFLVLYFLFGIVCALLVMCAALWIATKVMERRIEKMKGENNER